MHVLIAALGSRGDVQPFVALGWALIQRGHTVTLVTDRLFQALAQTYGLRVATFDADVQHHMASLVQVGHRNAARQLLELARSGKRTADLIFPLIHAEAQNVDMVVLSPLAMVAADIAVQRGVPFTTAAVQPLTPTAAFAHPLAPAWPRGWPGERLYNRGTYAWINGVLGWLARPYVNRFRTQVLGLPPRPWRDFLRADPFPRPMLYAFPEQVVPRPPEWGPDVHLTGYWLLPPPADWSPSPELQAFLEAGPPPVYVGFGSMVDPDPEGLTRQIIEALRLVGRRGILLGGWARLGRGARPKDILVVDEVPHTWLFPRCAAVVHHGGSGTTAAGLHAGVPAVVVPYLMDQPFWGRRVAALGVGPQPIPRRKLTAQALAQALDRALHDEAMRARAAALGQTLRAANGLAQAARQVEIIAQQPPRPL
ncbi:MAG: glycosyltransferase family 1 protein [Chloroflexi bacterium]|nr:glycosyltransferase family 1 protein [Chloroflexota bacterium]